MKPDVVYTALDIVSFLMITPEFLSEGRLQTISTFSLRAQQALAPWANIVMTVLPGLILIVMLLAFVGDIFHIEALENALDPIVGFSNKYYSDIQALNYGTWLLFGIGIVVASMFIIARVTWLIARRGVLFWFGAAFFIAPRLYLIVHSLTSHA